MAWAKVRERRIVMVGGYAYGEGSLLYVPQLGAERSYCHPNEDLRRRGLVDNDSLEWLDEPARPSCWELLSGPGWVV